MHNQPNRYRALQEMPLTELQKQIWLLFAVQLPLLLSILSVLDHLVLSFLSLSSLDIANKLFDHRDSSNKAQE